MHDFLPVAKKILPSNKYIAAKILCFLFIENEKSLQSFLFKYLLGATHFVALLNDLTFI